LLSQKKNIERDGRDCCYYLVIITFVSSFVVSCVAEEIDNNLQKLRCKWKNKLQC